MELSLHTASALPSGGDFSSPATAPVLICPLWWSISLASSTHTAITVQSSRSLTYQPPARVRSPSTTILVGNTGRSGCRHKHDVCFVTCQQEGACASSAAQRITTVVVTVVVVIWKQQITVLLIIPTYNTKFTNDNIC